MSHRAIQRLRQERGIENVPSEDEDESDDDVELPQPKSGFGFMLDMDDSDEDDSSSSEESDDNDTEINQEPQHDKEEPNHLTEKSKNEKVERSVDANVDPAAESEDFDALLEEFKSQYDDEDNEQNAGESDNSHYYGIIRNGIDPRDLDIDYVMRTSLLGAAEDFAAPARSNRRGRQASVFGPPRDNWPKPPHYVGGGIGMTTYDNQDEPPPLPWPYSEMKQGDARCPDLDRWFRFTYSENYHRDREDFERIKASGDPNALALFIAHHPFVVEALLQLSGVLYQTNQAQGGLSLLKRTLFVYECASANSFLKFEGRSSFIDYDDPINELFFAALFRLVRVSHVAGLSRASLAVSRLLLSLDPLRDPMGILLALDHFVLVSQTESNDKWLVDLVEGKKVTIHYKDDTSKEGYECDLLDMPNWAFSYALALWRRNENDPSEESEARAAEAARNAISRFPSVLEELLIKNEVRTDGRSFQTDWPSVLGYARQRSVELKKKLSVAATLDPVVKSCTSQAYELIVRIFVQQNYKLWSSDSVLKWMYRNLEALTIMEPTEVVPLSPALMRYARCDPMDYEDKFQTMPADANPLDPGLVAHAMVVDTNRPRFMQRVQRGGGIDRDQFHMAGQHHLQGTPLAGAPTEMIDPDWPILELFWRSALPWAHVEGVPPPRR